MPVFIGEGLGVGYQFLGDRPRFACQQEFKAMVCQGDISGVDLLCGRKGIVRDGQMPAAAVTVSAVPIRQIWFQSVSWWVMVPLVLLAGIVGANRADLYTTSYRARWWWMSRPPSE